MQKRVGDNGQLFGSVTANEIADALEAKGGKSTSAAIELAHPIKSIGVHAVDVRLHREVSAHIQVEVVPLGVEGSRKLLSSAAAPPAPAAPRQSSSPGSMSDERYVTPPPAGAAGGRGVARERRYRTRGALQSCWTLPARFRRRSRSAAGFNLALLDLVTDIRAEIAAPRVRARVQASKSFRPTIQKGDEALPSDIGRVRDLHSHRLEAQ